MPLRCSRSCCCLASVCCRARAGRRPPTCTGTFPNPITDICWSLHPADQHRRRARSPTSAARRTSPTRRSPVCSCGVNPTIGLSIGFWEPARHVEAVRKPFCLASLGGIDLDPGIPAPEAARFTRPEGDGDGGSFYQAHFYVNPVLYWLEVVTDFPCLERGSLRPGLPDRGRSAVERRRADADPEPRRRAVRQPGRDRGLRRRLRGRDRWASASPRCSGAPAARAASTRSTATCRTTWAACARPPCSPSA